MTELNDMDLMQKLLRALGTLREKAFTGAGTNFGPRAAFPGSGMKQQEHFGGGMPGGWSMGGSWPMGGRRMAMAAGPQMMGPRTGMMGHHRQSLIRENLLTIIAEAPAGIRAKEIAQKAGINQSSVSESLSKLADDGYIKRTVDPSDKRATLIFLTELGKARASEVKDEQTALFGHLFDNLSAAEKEELARLLDKIIDGDQPE